MDSHLVERELHRKTTSARYRHLSYLPSGFLPFQSFEHYILKSHETAATKIQSVWRGYRIRKTFAANKNDLRKSKAAIIIQRSVREWTHKRETGEILLKPRAVSEVYCLEKVNEDNIPKLQEEIDRWNTCNDANVESHEKLQRQLEMVQAQLGTFYESAATRKTRSKRCDAVCTQIEAIANVLTDLPSLEHCDQADISIFQTPVVRDARIARHRHKQQLKARTAPWWKRLHLQTENIL